MSDKVIFGKKGFKYFIGYEDDSGKVMLLCIMLPEMNAYKRDFEKTKYMSYLIKDNESLEKYHEIWDKACNIIKKGFYSDSVYSDKYLKTKIKSYEEKVNTNFHNDKMTLY